MSRSPRPVITLFPTLVGRYIDGALSLHIHFPASGRRMCWTCTRARIGLGRMVQLYVSVNEDGYGDRWCGDLEHCDYIPPVAVPNVTPFSSWWQSLEECRARRKRVSGDVDFSIPGARGTMFSEPTENFPRFTVDRDSRWRGAILVQVADAPDPIRVSIGADCEGIDEVMWRPTERE